MNVAPASAPAQMNADEWERALDECLDSLPVTGPLHDDALRRENMYSREDKLVGVDCLVDTNVILRAADRLHASSVLARKSMKVLFRQGNRLCLAKQSLLEAWVVATRPRGVNAFECSPRLLQVEVPSKAALQCVGETDDIYTEWEKLVYARVVTSRLVLRAVRQYGTGERALEVRAE